MYQPQISSLLPYLLSSPDPLSILSDLIRGYYLQDPLLRPSFSMRKNNLSDHNIMPACSVGFPSPFRAWSSEFRGIRGSGREDELKDSKSRALWFLRHRIWSLGFWVTCRCGTRV